MNEVVCYFKSVITSSLLPNYVKLDYILLLTNMIVRNKVEK